MNKEEYEAYKKLIDAEVSKKLEMPIVLTDEQKAEEPLEVALHVILSTYAYTIRAGCLASAGLRIGDVVKELASIAGDLEYFYPQLKKDNGCYHSRNLWNYAGHLNAMEMLKQKEISENGRG